jgi:hypothetical protein
MTVVTLLFLALTSFAPNRLMGFGQRRQTICIFIGVAGLSSFFFPLIKADPAVLGRAYWSPFSVIGKLYGGGLGSNADHGPVWTNTAVVYLSATYLFMAAILVILLIYPRPKLVVGFAASVPLVNSLTTRWASPYSELTASLQSLFYGGSAGQVDISTCVAFQVIASVGILATSYLETLDD